MSIFSPSAKPRNFYKIISLIFIFLLCNNTQAAQNAFDKELKHPPIPLLDEQGNHVLDGTHPYSPKKSCAGSGCHDYDAITSAYHFEMGRDEADDHYGEKRGLPHLSSPGYYGGYTCMGGNNQQVLAKKNNSSRQDFADYGSAGWVKTCMSCHAGGGWAEKDRNGIRYDEKDLTDVKPFDGDYYNRVTDPQTGEQRIEPWDWKKSGVSEADCLFCHTKFSKLSLPPNSGLSTSLSPIEARQALTAQDFFRQAPSGLLEYIKNTDRKHILNIARQEGDFVLNEQGLPIFNWNKEAFDDRGRVTLSMLRFPENENCMACHATSEFRRGFYGFGEAARQTLASIANGDDEEPGAGATLEDDYRDDIHKGTVFTADNGQKRTIESCNSCHSAQYYKPIFSNVDLSANHNFPKGNSDMDVRNDLDYKPNVLSCEQCHLKAVNAVFRKEYDSLLDSHRGGWKLKGDLSGYDEASLTQIVQTHFDSVACQTCHILNKTDADDNVLKLSYRYRLAEDGKTKISVYNPRLRYYWKDKTSGRVLFQHERNAVFKLATDGFGRPIGQIIDPISQQVLGKVSASSNNANATFRDPTSYEDYVALKTAYDSLLKNKGYKNANTTQVWIESNEYVISHNTRSAAESMPCLDCHARESNGNVSQLLSDNGLLGKNSKRTITTVPDNRLVTEGIISLGLAYNRLEKNGTITQSTYDIL